MNKLVNAVRNAALFGVTLAFLLALSSAQAAGPFDGLSGQWRGAGQINFSNGVDERIRCRATYAVTGGGNELSMQLVCASQAYKINAKGVARNSNGRIAGTFHEYTNEVDGTISGSARNGTVAVELQAKGYVFDLDIETAVGYQKVTITPHGMNIDTIIIEMHR